MDVAGGTVLRLLSLVESEATDARNYVRKAMNWALRELTSEKV